MSFAPEPTFQHDSLPKIGIVLVNLGTPDAPTTDAVRRYLREFLSDPRVIEIPPLVWKPLLHGVILRTRPRASAAKYAMIWRDDGSPLRVYTERQAQLLQGLLGEQLRTPIVVRHAMRYGNPPIGKVLAALQAERCERVLVLPLYPQYAASTTATALDKVFEFYARTRNVPELRTVKHFHDHPSYIRTLAESIRAFWLRQGRPDKLLMSFHGLPRFSLDRGDPYHCECHKTARLLAQELGLEADQWTLTFQSRFGRAEWLQPYTAATLEALGKQGVGRIDVVCPGFVSDCLETLEEIGIEGKQTFLQAGGREFHTIACLNDQPAWIAALADIARDHLHGWIDRDRAILEAAAQQAAQRARTLGASR